MALVKVAIAQLNCTLGDLNANSEKILKFACQASEKNVNLLLTPELSICGYPPEDLIFRQDFIASCKSHLIKLARQLPQNLMCLVGHPDEVNGSCFNAVSLISNGQVLATYHKQILPNHSVFDEVRYFKAGEQSLVFEFQGVKFGVLICADIWESEPAKKAKTAGAQVLLALNASPFHIDKQQSRVEIAQQRVVETGLPIIYANMVGGQDELVFDGGSFVVDDEGRLTQQLPFLEEALSVVSFENLHPLSATICPNLAIEESIYKTLCLGLKDYVQKNNFPSVLLGLSGGIDSALTLAIAVDALGADKVHAVMMPTEFTASMSVQDAQKMASNLGVKYSEIVIQDLYAAFNLTLKPEFLDLPFGVAEENLQARIRGTILMALSNKFGGLVITTGNKSETAVGYSTLYGDMAGGFSLIKDVSKTMVYKLSRYRNQISSIIPERIIFRAPSAELRHGQKDQDSLPDYEVLDAILEAYVEHDIAPREIVEMGFSINDVSKVIALIDRNEYKRQQAAIGIRITHKGFGKDRRFPITNKFQSLVFDSQV